MNFRKLSIGIMNCMPILSFLIIYLLSDIFGALVLFFQLEPFYSVFVYHTGISLPVILNSAQMQTFWLIAIGSPVIMFATFLAVFLPLNKKLDQSGPAKRDFDPPFLFILVLFGVFAGFGIYSVYRAGGFGELGTWGNYAELVEARWNIYATLYFFEFANLYQFIPAAAIVTLLVGIKKGGWARIVGIICAIVAVLVGVVIFQKKIVVTTMILTISSLVIYSYFINPKRVARIIGFAAISALTLLAVFFVASVVPTLSNQKSAVGNSANTTQDVSFVKEWREQVAQTAADKLRTREELAKEQEALSKKGADKVRTREDTAKEQEALRKKAAAEAWKVAEQNPFINDPLVVALTNLTMRTSVPAVYYVAVFPDLHPYFPLDLGQDILGFGGMPNDNSVVWKQMYPDMPGLVAAPFNFIHYSQGGLIITYVMSALVGLLVGSIWAVILQTRGSMALRAALGAIVVVGTTHLALDALRNTIIVSYGFAWGLVPLLVLLIAGLLRRSRNEAITVSD